MTGINRRDKKLKYNSAAIWTILNLMSYLKIYLQIAEMSGNKHIGYFYEKGNFMADTILKLRQNWTTLTLRCCRLEDCFWLDLPYCRNWARNKPTTTAFHVKRSWKTFLRETDLNTPATNFPLGFKFARWVCTNLNHVSRSLFIVELKWAEIPAFISDLLLHPCTRQRSGMIRFE